MTTPPAAHRLRSVISNTGTLTGGRLMLAVLRFGVTLLLVQRAGLERFGEFALILSVVAIASVHWPEVWRTWAELAQGYVFTDKGFGNFKYPVVLMGMLWTLLWMGPGRLSFDYVLRSRCANHKAATPITLADNMHHKPTV